eukprot:COSAG04_NODE_1986_length_5067_cov_2.041667_6_plen_354_part_00
MAAAGGYTALGPHEQRSAAALFVSAARARAVPRWILDGNVSGCMICDKQFGVFSRKHHCRSCGWAVCAGCSEHKLALDRWLEEEKPHALREDRRSDAPLRVCDMCRVVLTDPAREAELEPESELEPKPGPEPEPAECPQPEPELEPEPEPEPGLGGRETSTQVGRDVEPPGERARLVNPNEEHSADGVGRDSVPGAKPRETTQAKKKPCCLCCRVCLLELKEKKIRGFRLSQFLGLVLSVVTLTADVWMDWALVMKWFLQGDIHWAETGLVINLLSGSLFGLPLAWAALGTDIKWWQKTLAAPAALFGLLGLGPVAAAIMVLYGKDSTSGPETLRMIAGVELLFEALPQSILQ